MMITAFAFGLSVEVHARFQTLFELPLLSQGRVTFGPFDPVTKNITFTTPDARGNSRLFLLQFMQKRITYLGITKDIFQQNDCGVGVFEVTRPPKGDSYRFFHRFIDGKQVGGLAWHSEDRRVGLAIQQKDKIVDLQGKILAENVSPPPPQSDPAFLGPLIWNGKRRLSIVGRGDTTGDVKDVVELDRNWKKGNRHWLSDYAMTYTKLVGNPDLGSFAVFEDSNRSSLTTAIYNNSFKRIWGGNHDAMSGDHMYVSDVGPNGIVTSMTFLSGANEYIGTGEVLCLDSNTGKVKWRGKLSGKWFGNNLIAYLSDATKPNLWPGLPIVSGKTGKVIGKMPQVPKGFLYAAADGNYCYSVSKSNSIVVYRMTIR